jgi:hypothetical protein
MYFLLSNFLPVLCVAFDFVADEIFEKTQASAAPPRQLETGSTEWSILQPSVSESRLMSAGETEWMPRGFFHGILAFGLVGLAWLNERYKSPEFFAQEWARHMGRLTRRRRRCEQRRRRRGRRVCE